MPTSPQETLQSHDVYPCTLTPRAPGPGAMARRAWLRLLGWAAAARLAVPQAWDQRARAPSGPTVLGHLARQCSALNARAGPRHALPWDRRGGPSSRGRPQPSPGGHAPLLPLGHRRCRGPGAPRSPGAGPRAGHADQGPRGTPRPAPWGHAGAAEAAGAARPRLVQGAGAARSEHGGGAVPQARGQPWANAPHGGRPPRPLGPGGQATRAMAP